MGVVDDLRRVPLFEELSEEELAALAEVAFPKVFQKGEIVCEKGDPGETLYIIRAGKVRIFTTDADGQEVALNIYGKGDFFGELSLLDGLPRSASVDALEEINVLALERAEFMAQLESHPKMILSILATICKRLRMTTERAERMAFLNIYGRVALQLLDLAEEHGRPVDRGIEIDLDLTLEDLASLAGVAPEGLERVLKFYSQGGLVDIHWPRVTVLDHDSLRQRLTWHRRKRLV
jgi:CRP-like cAMP-binding protein